MTHRITEHLPTSTTRVPRHTPEAYNRRIHEATRQRIEHYRQHLGQIGSRLIELDREWDIERTLEANAASLALAGTLLGFTHRAWLALPTAVTAFLLQHAIQGWCPPVPLLRHLGVRTRQEIEQERHALKLIRGDYGSGWSDRPTDEILDAVR